MDDRQLTQAEIAYRQRIEKEHGIFPQIADCLVEIYHEAGEAAAEYAREACTGAPPVRTVTPAQQNVVLRWFGIFGIAASAHWKPAN